MSKDLERNLSIINRINKPIIFFFQNAEMTAQHRSFDPDELGARETALLVKSLLIGSESVGQIGRR